MKQYPHYIIEVARKLRRTATPAEKIPEEVLSNVETTLKKILKMKNYND